MPIVFDSMGYKLDFVSGSLNGMENLRQNPEAFDLVFVDMVMHNMSGIDLVKAIRTVNREVPIVISSAFQADAVHDVFKSIEKECNLFYRINYFVIEKPLSADRIFKIVNTVLRRLVSLA